MCKRVVGQQVGGDDHQAGGLQRVAPADRVERVLQVVGAGRDVTPAARSALTAVSARGIATWHAAALEEQVGLGEGDDTDPGRGDLLGHLALALLGLHAEAARSGWP